MLLLGTQGKSYMRSSMAPSYLTLSDPERSSHGYLDCEGLYLVKEPN